MNGAQLAGAVDWLLDGPVVEAQVRGVPVPQGSIRSLGRGRPSVHSNAPRLLPWREQVQRALEDAMGPRPLRLTGPVAVDVTFTVGKPKSAPKRRRVWPVARPDGDKLLRAVFDAATCAGVWGDDSQVVEWSGRKTFPGEHPLALLVPGAWVRVWTVTA